MVRYFSTDDDFMHHKANDLFYAFLISMADYKKENNKLFLNYCQYLDPEVQDELMKICKYNSKRSLNNCLEDYKKRGLITIEDIEWNGFYEKSIVFKNDFEKYQEVNNDVIEYLYKTSNRNCIRIYVYLLNKLKYAEAIGKNYNFTYKELAMVMGYKAERPSETVVKNIKTVLDCFMRQEIIKYKKIFVQAEKSSVGFTSYMELIKVAERVADMRSPEPEVEYKLKNNKKNYIWE